jgi:hypothetical protein
MSDLVARTRAVMEEMGYTTARVEFWNPHSKRHNDLFGLFDILAISAHQTWGVQVTSRSNASSRRKKMQASPLLAKWCQAERIAVLFLWQKKKGRWEHAIEPVHHLYGPPDTPESDT